MRETVKTFAVCPRIFVSQKSKGTIGVPKKKIELTGVYKEMEIIQMNNGKILVWSKLIDEDAPLIPFGTKIEMTLTYNDDDFLNGSDGIVWATYSRFQVETIVNALFVQNILGEIRISNLEERKLYLVFIQNPEEKERAIDFIWREKTGLRLKLDWQYSANQENESFDKWLNAK